MDPIYKMINSLPAYHNFNAVVSCGLGVGGLALLGEDKRAEKWVARAVKRAGLYCDEQGKDGGAFEGAGYGDYASRALADLLWALNSAQVPNTLAEHAFIKTLPRYAIGLLNPNDFYQPTFGDGGPTRGFGTLMMALALDGDTDAAWYCQRIGRFDPAVPRTLIAADPQRIKPKQPEWEPLHLLHRHRHRHSARRVPERRRVHGLQERAAREGDRAQSLRPQQFSDQLRRARGIAADPGYKNRYKPEAYKYTVSTFGHNSVVLDLHGNDYLKKFAPHGPRTRPAVHDQGQDPRVLRGRRL